MRNKKRLWSILIIGLTCWVDARSALAEDALSEGFDSPPSSARPRVWWHWMNGNISKEGIQKDLEWMKRIGIGGMHSFDGAWDTPPVVNKRLAYMTPEWQDAFRFAATLADRMGLELAIASSAGWSETGGPWVKPEDGMKKLVWSETRVTGSRPFNGKLASPPSVAGPFQAIPIADKMARQSIELPSFYRDVAVLAYRTPPTLQRDPAPVAVTTSAASIGSKLLLDRDLTRSITLSTSMSQPAWVLYDYGEPRRFRSASVAEPTKTLFHSKWVLEASDDGKVFHRVTELPRERLLPHVTVSFPVVTARFLRLIVAPAPTRFVFDFAANAPGAEFPSAHYAEAGDIKLNELRFYSGARIHRFEEKAAFSIDSPYYAIDSGASAPDEAVDPVGIIDLTSRMRSDGALNWNPPPGDWTVLRLGYSLTGKVNHPASAEATGLEVDKLDPRAVRAYLDTYLGRFEKMLGGLIGARGLTALVTDSIETGPQNWTPAFITEFKARRGYDPMPWLPALTGVIVGDASRTDRFLWDIRKTLGELMSDAHYRQVAESAHQHRLTYYGESLEGYFNGALGDDLDMRQYADIPMGSLWASYKSAQRDGMPEHLLDLRGAASVAHVYGKDLVAAESLTSLYEPWIGTPASLRPVIDLAFALGVNRPVIHTSVHQPTEQKPGLTLGPFGQHFTRHETWAEMAGPWITYLSRSAYLLQQGQFVADVAWFYGEEGPLAAFVEAPLTDLPQGYGFDFVNANMLLNHLSVREGRLVSTGGARYRLLYLGGSSKRMTLPVLRKLAELSTQGVAIAGRRPTGSPSLVDEAWSAEYESLVAALWGSGKIIDSTDPNEILARLGIARDYDYDKPKPDSRILFLHRQLPDGDIYFLTNRNPRTENIEARLRVTGRTPELWHADSGRREAVSWRVEEGKWTVVPLELYANQSLFIVFREPTSKTAEQVVISKDRIVTTIDGDWSLNFEPGRGAPHGPLRTSLGSWTDSRDAGIKYFSGIGTYQKDFRVEPRDIRVGQRMILDLGDVGELADVIVNGQAAATVWHAPYRADVTALLKPGVNKLEVRVANLWVNRLIGDKQPGAAAVAFTVTSTYTPDAPLRRSGLIGPVTLISRAP